MKYVPKAERKSWHAQGIRIVNARKSKYYDTALSNFENAKRCFERAGLIAAREKTVIAVRAAKTRWIGRQRRDNE